MALQSFAGNLVPIGPSMALTPQSGINNPGISAVNASIFCVGRVVTADGASHTIDTSGSSSLAWRSGSNTFASGSTTVVVGLAAVDAASGPPSRPVTSSNVITPSVSASFTGGGGGITSSAVQTSVPTSGTMTIAHGDLVAFFIQMTARGGADSIRHEHILIPSVMSRPSLVVGNGSGGFTAQTGRPNVVITFSEGVLGHFEGCDVFSSLNNRTWNSGSATKEYGQAYQLPYPVKVCGVYGFGALGGDTDVVLYSDILGSPVAEKTVAIDANTVGTASGSLFYERFSSPYNAAANQLIGAVLKPGGTNITAYYKTLGAAGHRATDPWGTAGYGISRASGAFANANSSLDHYYIGLLVSALDDAVSAGGAGVGVIGS
jgi:hypothetical protein